MRYRVEQLAAACDVSVDTIRYYQAKGLLPGPAKEGRVAIYGAEHADRIRRIRSLQRRGLTLAVIKRLLEGTLARGDAGLAAAVAAAQAEGDGQALLSIDEVAERSGVPVALLRSVERAGLPIGRRVDGEDRYSVADVETVRAGLRLLEAGFPLHDLLALAAEYHDHARATAERAVELFDAYVRKPLRESAVGEDEADQRLVEAFGELLPAVTLLVAHHFRRVLLAVAEERIED